MIGSDVGGCYDLHARAVARHLTKHIPGNPVFVPQNRFDAAKPNWIGNPTVDNLGHDRGPRMPDGWPNFYGPGSNHFVRAATNGW